MTTSSDTLTAHARGTLNFIFSISGRYLLSAQHNYISVGDAYTRQVAETVGRTPLIWGSDFSFKIDAEAVDGHYHCGPLNVSDPGDPDARLLDVTVKQMRDRMIETAVEQHRRGHIVTLMWHCPFPPHGDQGDYATVWTFENRPDTTTWRDLTTTGTTLNSQWCDQVDRIAAYLTQLKAAGVPVLWRPYHEMNGVWFWWCNHPGENGFKRLWTLMYERFTVHHGLDNLIWVWNANAPRDRPGDEAFDYRDFYPGADCVDILAADIYRNDYRQSHHDELLALADGKPIALGEVGEVPATDTLERQPHWAWFMPWGCLVGRRENTRKVPLLYQSERVVGLEDVERDTRGEYRIKR